MIIVGNTIVSDDIADRCFCCDLACCKGACCVEGDSGAPLLEEEVPILEAILPAVEPYMTAEGREAVRQQGVAVRDKDGDLGTPLIDGGACAYAIQENGLTLCAIEKAYRDSLTPLEGEKVQSSHLSPFTFHLSPFTKPVSCHLYPIRVEDYGEFTAVNYHQWDICHQKSHSHQPHLLIREGEQDATYSPLLPGEGQGVRLPLYIYLKEPLIRRFGQEWYDELLQEISNRNEQK